MARWKGGPWYGYPAGEDVMHNMHYRLLVGGRGIDVKKKKGEEVEGEKDNLLFYLFYLSCILLAYYL